MLYDDAVKRKIKLDKLQDNYRLGIELNSRKIKISNNSHKIALQKIEKIVDEVVEKYERENSKKLSFIDLGLILTELKIFREIFNENKIKEISNLNFNISNNNKSTISNKSNSKLNNQEYQSYREIKTELKKVKNQEKRKRQEVDFYEQLWIILNPENKDFIRSDMFAEFLKILLSPISSNIYDISNVLKEFLQAAFFLNYNNNFVYLSPITEVELNQEEIWSLEKLVKEFLNLKENILAYQHIGKLNKKAEKNLKKETSFLFQPNVEKQYLSRSNFFEERLPILLERDKQQKISLEERKKELENRVIYF